MFKNHLKIAVRNLLKNKVSSLINILGLALGITCALLIYLWVLDELSYDKFHTKASRTYLITEKYKFGDKYAKQAKTPYPVAPLLKDNIAGIESYVRIDNFLQRNQYVKINGEAETAEIIPPDAIGFTDSSFYNVFSFKLLAGDPATCLSNPNAVVLTKERAKKYFGSENPVGKSVKLTNVYNDFALDLHVTGVMESMPGNSHVHKEVLIAMQTIDTNRNLNFRLNNWNFATQYSYVVLSDKTNAKTVKAAIGGVLKTHADQFTNDTYSFDLMPLTDIYLRSDLDNNIGEVGDIRYVYLFGIIALLTLLISCINYMNLSTARSSLRAREVGMRKVLGAERKQIIIQLLAESFLTTLLALLISCLLILLVLPYFNTLSGKTLSLGSVSGYRLILLFVPVLLVVSLMSGSYPAVYLSSFQPVKVLKGSFMRVALDTVMLRKILVVFQFTASIILITSTIIIYNQWQFLRTKKLGLNPEQVVTLPVQSQKFVNNYKSFKNELLKSSSVQSVTACNKNITDKFFDYASTYVNNSDEQLVMAFGAIDYDFFETMNIGITEGRSFSKSFPADMEGAVIINESAKKFFSLDQPLGNILKIGSNKTEKTIVGVVKDFNFEDLHSKIVPMIFFPTEGYINNVFIKVKNANLDQSIADINKVFKSFQFEEPFQYAFLDESVANQYKAEQRFLRIFVSFSVIAIFIACLGLFSLVAFIAQQRTKEIGIRKVIGASVFSIVTMLSKDFISLVIIATLLSFPIAWWGMSKWLEDFAYRVDISWWTFVLAGILALFIALATLCMQAVKAATTNPIKSLRTE